MHIHSYSPSLAVFLTQSLKFFSNVVYNKRERDKTFLCVRNTLAIITMRKRTSPIASFQKSGCRKLVSRCHQDYVRLVGPKQWASYVYQIMKLEQAICICILRCLVCIFASCLVCIVVSCLVYIVVSCLVYIVVSCLVCIVFSFLVCIVVSCLVFIVVSCLVCIVVILGVFVVYCVYCCFYFRCQTAG